MVKNFNYDFSDYLDRFLDYAIEEDIKEGDHTTLATIPGNALGKASLLVKEDGIVAGLELAQKIFEKFDPSISLNLYSADGDQVKQGTKAFTVEGSVRTILTAERLVLNFIQYLSGIATKTNRLVKKVEGYPVELLDTRKTTPGLRMLEKWAVRIGGGANHRMGLYDVIMIKDNHIDYAGNVIKAIDSVKKYLQKNNLDLDIIVEARTLKEVKALNSVTGIRRVLLDNMNVEDMKQAVEMVKDNLETEASGGIKEKNLEEVASTGVNYISTSELTSDIHSLDFSLKLAK